MHDRAVGADAKFTQRNSVSFFRITRNMLVACKRELNEQAEGLFFQLIVSEMWPPFVQCCLSRECIWIGCDVSDSDRLTAIAKHRGENVQPTRKTGFTAVKGAVKDTTNNTAGSSASETDLAVEEQRGKVAKQVRAK